MTLAEVQTNGLLESNKDWDKFIHLVSEGTKKLNRPLWKKNIDANVERVKTHGWAVDHCWEVCKDKTAVMIGASPAINKQLERLRSLQHDPNFVLIGISSGIAHLVKNGIYPKYVLVADADDRIAQWFDGLTDDDMKKMTLIANLFCHPKVLDKWTGEKSFLAIWTSDNKLDKRIARLYAPINGNGDFFHALSSQYNTGVALAYLVMQARIIIFVGNELGFADAEVPYYADRKDLKDRWKRLPHPDIYGKVAYTGYMFMALKLGLEDYLGKLPGWFLNATEAGIFGVSARYGNLPWIKQLKLDMAIAHARNIMKTGSPIYIH